MSTPDTAVVVGAGDSLGGARARRQRTRSPSLREQEQRPATK